MYPRYLWSQSFLRDFDIRIPFDPSKCVLIWILMWMSVFWHRSPKSSLSLTCHSILIKDKQDQSCEAGLWRIGSIVCVHHLLAYAVPIFQFANFPMTFRQKDFYNASEKRKLFSGGWQNEKKVWENIEMYYAWKKRTQTNAKSAGFDLRSQRPEDHSKLAFSAFCFFLLMNNSDWDFK